MKESLEDAFDDDFKFKSAIKEVKSIQETQKTEFDDKIKSLKEEMNSIIQLSIQQLKENHENELLKLKNKIELTNKIFEEKTVKTTEELNQFKLKKLEEEKFNLKVDFDEIKKNYDKLQLEMIENQNKFQLLLEEKQQQILELTLKQEKEISELKIQNELKLKKNETKSELQHQKTIENLKKDFEIHLKNFEKKILQEHEVKKLEKSKKIEEEKNDENDNKVIKKTEEFEKISIPQNLKEIFDEINSNETDQLDLHDMNLTDEEVSNSYRVNQVDQFHWNLST